MTRQHTVTPHGLEFDVVLDEWPDGAQGDALHSLVASGDVLAVLLPYGFVGLKIIPAQILIYAEAGRMHVKQVFPTLGARVPQHYGPGLRLPSLQDSRL